MAGPDQLRVVVAGGGVAGIEALLALRDLASDRVELTLVAPERDFVYRPMAVAQPFSLGHARRHRLAAIARDAGAEIVADALAAVHDPSRRITLRGGGRLAYDALLIAVGARAEPALERALTWTPKTEPERLGGLLRELEEGYITRVAFVVPHQVGWSLPAYELALMTAREAHGMGCDDAEVGVYSSESAPLAIFGEAASRAVSEQLSDAGVSFHGDAYVAVEPGRPSTLVLQPGDRRVEVDRVVALPRAVGPAVDGIPSDESGFLPVDEHCRVAGCERVWAAGDGIAFAIKQGGLATQQADAAAEAIAALAGASVEPRGFRPVLRGMLLTGRASQWMRSEIAGGAGDGSTARHALWWPPTKIAGRYLAPYLAELDEAADLGVVPHPDGQPVELDLERELGLAVAPSQLDRERPDEPAGQPADPVSSPPASGSRRAGYMSGDEEHFS